MTPQHGLHCCPEQRLPGDAGRRAEPHGPHSQRKQPLQQLVHRNVGVRDRQQGLAPVGRLQQGTGGVGLAAPGRSLDEPHAP
eukprot:CAMPEP_0179178114 /NCGR_PEP_ID=MMETSP0796-20121207/88105_1 /TAXON_ID=73915 /ORGANISM="Pyrodinium bahamense, Strain pbaha01" /LENGTH=81 /DNA_ID=CAMNT_0020881699 /DNA_START=44 /DNA_END=286 /DNA_ORIENTATION=+